MDTENALTPELQNTHINIVSSHQGKNEKLAWKRKIKKMEGFIAELGDYEEAILELVKAKQPTIDDINKLRLEMVRDCIHPKDHLLHHGTHLECKFCNRKISIPKIAKVTTMSDLDSDDE